MAKFSFDSYAQREANSGSNNQQRKVGYFSLKDDGDEAIVRFDYSTPEEFEIVTVHNVQVDGKWRRVSCLRDGNQPLACCPLCAAGERLAYKFYVRLVEYTKDENGQVVAQAKIWERPASFAKILVSNLTEYGDLRNQLFKVKRCGAKGSMDTTYTLMYANPSIYKEELGYVKDFSAFENFDTSHHSYMKKSFEDMQTLLATGSFPEVVKQQSVQTQNVQQPQQVQYQQPVYQQPTQNVQQSQQTYERQPAAQQSTQSFRDPTVSRPRRTYDFE